MCTNHDRIYSIHVQSVELLYVVFFFSKGQFIWHKIVFQLQRIKLQKLFANFTLRIWIFFSKQSIYLEETTVQRNKPQETKSQNKFAWIYSAFVKISTSTTEYELLRSVLRGSICHFQSNLWRQLHVIQPPSSDSSFYKRNSVWFRELELDYGYFITCCLPRKISGREIAGVWKLARLVTADWSMGDFQRWREMSESDVNTSLY